MSLFDTHAHLNSPDFKDDVKSVVERAIEAGVDKIVVPGTNPEDSEQAIKLSIQFHGTIYAAVGLHPHDSERLSLEMLKMFEDWLEEYRGNIVAVGEIGLDFYRNYAPRGAQFRALEAQLDMALRHSLPVILHVREAFDEIFEVIEGYQGLKGIFHCFSGNVEDMVKAVDMGFYVSFAGNITYRKSTGLIDVLRNTPVDKILIETDSPYLSPIPHRGKRNEPAYIVNTFKKVVDVRDEDESYLENQLYLNSLIAFALDGEKDNEN